jgi:hypothetical protein
MKKTTSWMMCCALSGILSLTAGDHGLAQSADPAGAQPAAVQAPEPLSAEELEILVARIALYPDELVAVIAASSLYPLQIIEAQRYLDQVKTKPGLKPKPDWDGSVVSLLNYPEIIKMMSDDLDWTQALGEAISNQQKDVLGAIQQLRDKAVAKGIIKSDDKVKVVKEKDTIVIKPASPEVIYVPVYEPQMLYQPVYVPAPVAYYPQPYPSYYYPTAPYFAAFVTGAAWAAVVDWDDGGVWGGNGWGNDIDIDCNNCFNNNYVGKVNFNDVDWTNVDRSKVSFDNNQLNRIDNDSIRTNLEQNRRNSIGSKSSDLKRQRPSTMPAGGNQVSDVRKSTLDGLQGKSTGKKTQKPAQVKPTEKKLSKADQPGGNKKPGNYDRPAAKPKPAAKPDVRTKAPSPLGDVGRGRDAKSFSNRGGESMGGGLGGGGRPQKRRLGRG